VKHFDRAGIVRCSSLGVAAGFEGGGVSARCAIAGRFMCSAMLMLLCGIMNGWAVVAEAGAPHGHVHKIKKEKSGHASVVAVMIMVMMIVTAVTATRCSKTHRFLHPTNFAFFSHTTLPNPPSPPPPPCACAARCCSSSPRSSLAW